MQKVPDLVVNKRMLQGRRVKYTKEKKEVPGWCAEEMKERPNVAVEEDTEGRNDEKNLNFLREEESQRKKQRNGKLMEKRRELRERNIRGFLNKFELEGLMAQKRIVECGTWRRRNHEGKRELPNEEGDVVREF